MGTWKDCVRGMLANLVQVEGESLERYLKRTQQLYSEGDVYGEDDMHWVVRAFINGLVDDELHCAMQAARKKNRSMTLGQAYEELIDLTSPRDVLNSYHIAGPALTAKAENSIDELSIRTGASGAPNFPGPHAKSPPRPTPRGGAGHLSDRVERGGASFLAPRLIPHSGALLFTGPRPVHHLYFIAYLPIAALFLRF